MTSILSAQAELIASLQREAIELRSLDPPKAVTAILAQIREAVAPLEALKGSGLDTYYTISQIQQERDAAVMHLCKLIDLILGTTTLPTMTYTQEQVDAAYAKSQTVLALADDTTDKSKIQELQAQLNTTQSNLSKFVAEFTDQASSSTSPPTTTPDPTTETPAA